MLHTGGMTSIPLTAFGVNQGGRDILQGILASGKRRRQVGEVRQDLGR